MSRIVNKAAVTAMLVALAGPAAAHVVLTPEQAVAGRPYVGALRVGHGCNGSATRSLRAILPPEVTSARPQAKPGWTIKLERDPAPDGKGGVSAITWSGGLVPDDEYDDFGLQLGVIAHPGPVFLTVIQTCEQGESRWEERPVPGQDLHGLKRPAAMLTIVAPPPLAALAGLEVLDGWVRATPSGAPTAAAYLTVRNTGAKPDRLVSISTTAAEKAELHTMSMDGGVMRMRSLPYGLAIPGGGEVRLAAGGDHIMLIGPKAAVAVGGRIELTLHFRHAGALTVVLPIQAGEAGAAIEEHHHGGA